MVFLYIFCRVFEYNYVLILIVYFVKDGGNRWKNVLRDNFGSIYKIN